MEPEIKKTAVYTFGILASAVVCFLALYGAALFSSVSGHWIRAAYPWTDRAAYVSLALSLLFFSAFVYFTMKISTPNADMTIWQKIRYRCAVFAVTFGFICSVLAIALFLYIFVFYKSPDAEAGIFVAFPFPLGFVSLSIAAALAFSVRGCLSKKVYRWLTVPAIVIVLLWSSAAFIGGIMTTINDASRWKH
jgi:hypothetical protein